VNTNKKFVALVVALILLVCLMALASLQVFRKVERASQTREKTLGVLMRADALLSDLVDAEGAVRGFLLTGQDDFLGTVRTVSERLRTNLETLVPMASSAEGGRQLMAVLPVVDAKLALMAHVVQLRSSTQAVIPSERFAVPQSKLLMDEIRTGVGGFIREERAQLARQDVELDASMRWLLTLIVTACTFTLMLALFFAYLIFRESRHQAKSLMHLETRRLLEVQEEANKQLHATNVALHISEEKLAVTLNSIDDAVIATDAEGLVTLLNPLAERLTGWTRAEAYHRPVEEVFHILHADTRKPYPVPVRETLAFGTTLSLVNQTIAIARDGSECHIADSCAPIRDRRGHVVGAVLVFRDVTDRIQVDRVLQEKNAELERARAVADKANLAKSEFLSSMSHELRTPLSAILGFAQLIDTGTPPPNDEQKRSVDQILKAGWYLLDLINEILDLALIESGKLSLSMEPISLTEVMQECQAMTETQAQARGITVTFPQTVEAFHCAADRTRLKQVLINLLSNAIKYNVPGGSVSVTVEAVSPGRLRVSVKDDGTGLTPAQRAQLFQPFNRLGQELTTEEGTGIGLVMTKRLVELMEGSIGVESVVGKGSLFWFELNATAHARTALTPDAARLRLSSPPHEGAALRTLLYVEDNPANLMLIEDIIARRPDIHLISEQNGISGIRTAIAALPDVILMDINLPGISGIDAMLILAKDPLTAHIPVVALSANAMPRDIEKGLEAGFYRYLTKPIRVDVLIETLDVAFAESASRLPHQADHPAKAARFGT